jgi:hypothetical protein
VHQAWHILVLASTLLGAAGAFLLLASSLVFDTPPPGMVRARPVIIGAIALAAGVVAVEWFVIH